MRLLDIPVLISYSYNCRTFSWLRNFASPGTFLDALGYDEKNA